MRKQKYGHKIWILCMTLATLGMITPIIMMVTTSFKTMEEIKSPVFHLLPEKFSFVNYIDALNGANWVIYFRNSVFITLAAVLFSILFNSISGFAFARLKFKGSKVLFMFILIGLMMPPQVTMLPTFLIMAKFPLAGGNDLLGAGGTGLINSFAGLIIPLVSGSYGIFLCKQFYENFPKSLDEAAEIDGCNKWRTYFTIYLPNSKAIIATLGLTKSVAVWNDYMWPLIMTNSDGMKTVQLALTMFKSDGYILWNQLMAASVIVVIPMVIIFLCAQKYFVQGIVTSGLK